MSKKSHITTVTPLPAGITRETVMSTLHNHTEMIDLNPLVIERHPIRPPPEASPEEAHCSWYCVRDKITYIPGLYKGELAFNACFHDLPDGLQTHIIAPMGLDMKGRWTLGGTLPGEPRQAVELGLGVPKQGLWLREDVDMKCNVVMTGFVKKTTKKTHLTLVERLIEKSHLKEGENYNNSLREQIDLRNSYPPDYHATASTSTSPSIGGGSGTFPMDQKNLYPPAHVQDPSLNHPIYRQHPPGVGDRTSVGSAGQYNPRHSGMSGSGPMPGQQQPLPVEYQNQNLYATPQTASSQPMMPSHVKTGSYHAPHPHQGGAPPYPTQAPAHFTAELPSEDMKTPVELDSTQGPPR